MSLLHYFGEQPDERNGHPDRLQWPGTMAGFPILGAAGNLTDNEYEELEHCRKFHCQWFYLAKAEDLAKYIYVKERILNGWFGLVHEDRRDDPEQNHIKVWLEWYQIYGVPSRNVLTQPQLAMSGGQTFRIGADEL